MDLTRKTSNGAPRSAAAEWAVGLRSAVGWGRIRVCGGDAAGARSALGRRAAPVLREEDKPGRARAGLGAESLEAAS
jgi:hypothetical protein